MSKAFHDDDDTSWPRFEAVVLTAREARGGGARLSIRLEDDVFSAILPFVLKWKRDPCTGKPCTSADLVTLVLERNEEEDCWQCPILSKAFKDHSKIIAIRQGQIAHVYSYQAYKTLNVQAKNYTDLQTGEPFDPAKDVLVLRDPEHPNKSSSTTGSPTAKKRPAAEIKSSSSSKDESIILAQDVTGVAHTISAGAASFTSTGMTLNTSNALRPATAQEILDSQCRMLASLKQKGYVRLITNVGNMVVEVHADIVPRTATNFLGLCAAKRYDGTKFHRLIPGFMIQGGKSTGGEETSLWGEPFRDEFNNRLKHDARGVVAMANAGPDTNKQQFYICFGKCPHLDRKHSVFGQVVRGLDILDQMEHVGSDIADKPNTRLIIERTEIIANPVETAQVKEKARIAKLQQKRQKSKKNDNSVKKPKTSDTTAAATDSAIGKYLQNRLAPGKTSESSILTPPPPKSAPKKKSTFGNFSGW
eukprot:scaffold20209_cov182-Amphora_coffeaeformis.AAC.2